MTPEELERFAALERRVAELEARLNRPEPAPVRLHPMPPRPSPPPAPPVSPPAAVTAPPASRPMSPETAPMEWLSRIAAVTVVLALAFFFDYAFQNHWIGETGRVLLGLLCGAAAVFFGDRFWSKGQRAFGQSLAAAGIAFFYLSFWAAFALYHLAPQPVAFALMLLTTAGAGTLAFRFGGPAVAMLGLAGGYATPLLLQSTGQPWFLLGYALLLNIGAIVAARRRDWPAVEAIALAGSTLLYIYARGEARDAAADTTFILVCLGLFVSSPWLGIALAEVVVAALTIARVWAPSTAALATALVCACAGLVAAHRRRWPLLPLGSFAAFWFAYVSWSSSAETGAVFAPLAWVTIAFLILLGWNVLPRAESAPTLFTPEALLIPFNAGCYFAAGYNLLQPGFPHWTGLFAVATAAVHFAAGGLLWKRNAVLARLAAGSGLVLLALAVPIQFTGYPVAVAWSVEAAAIAWIGTQVPGSKLVASVGSLVLFSLVLFHLGLVDSGLATGALLANSRFFAFAVAAISLWVTGYWIGEGTAAAAAWIAGHTVMLWGLGLETDTWAARTAGPENARSLSSAALSVVAAAYAVALFAGGTARRHDLTRRLGIVLIALVILKLYLYDVWFLAALYRMVAFAILGLLLLLISYLYSRYRGSIESWWRP
jgi:uncharacterized membrane protein